MPRTLKIILNTLLWVGVVAFVVFFHSRADEHRATTKVHTLSVSVVDSLQDEMLVTSQAVREWIAMSGIATVGEAVGDVDLAGIERCIRGKGFVDRASAYLTYDGELRVEVSQRRPLMRLMVDGYDCYVTEQGFVFPAPEMASVYVPVITGEYRPPVERDYVGLVGDYIAQRMAAYEEVIDTLQYDKVPLFEMSDIIADSVRTVRRMQVDRKGWLGGFKGPFEDYDEFDARVEAKREEKAQLRRALRYLERENNKRIDAVSRRQQAEVEKQKKLLKRYEDFLKLINFVKYIEEDSFWRAEIVQIVASTMSSGDLRIDLIPRTGNHRVRFGRVENVEAKLDKLLAFYQNGLSNIGWDSFRTISVEYHGQVVCTKN
mgnify:CR=1 FL=1